MINKFIYSGEEINNLLKCLIQVAKKPKQYKMIEKIFDILLYIVNIDSYYRYLKREYKK